ncbi:hypothetical protein Tco_0919443 [Tanacetum coccineum]
MLKKFGLEDSKPTKTPMSTEIKLTKEDEADSMDSSKYRGNQTALLLSTDRSQICLCQKGMSTSTIDETSSHRLRHTPQRRSDYVKSLHKVIKWTTNELKIIYIEFIVQEKWMKNLGIPTALLKSVSSMNEESFTFHEHVMDPLDISRNPSKEKGKKIASPPVISSLSSSSDNNEAPSFLKFYDELSDTMTSSSKTNSPNFKIKTARMSVKYPNYVNLTSSSEEQPNERTPSTPPRKKSLSLPQAPSKLISSKSTHYTSSSSPSESPTPTHVAPPPKLCFVILIKLEPQELPPLQVSPNDPYV